MTPQIVAVVEDALWLPWANAFWPGICYFALLGNVLMNVVVSFLLLFSGQYISCTLHVSSCVLCGKHLFTIETSAQWNCRRPTAHLKGLGLYDTQKKSPIISNQAGSTGCLRTPLRSLASLLISLKKKKNTKQKTMNLQTQLIAL